MGVIIAENQWRADGCFEALHARRLNGEWQKDIRIANGVVIKEIPHSGVKVRERRDPVAQRNGDPVFLLNVALALQGKERDSMAGRELEQWSRHCVERRRLVVIRISGPQYPIEFRDADGHSQTRIRGVLSELTVKVRKPNPSGQG